MKAQLSKKHSKIFFNGTLQELTFLVAFITALVKDRSANQTEIATDFTGKAKSASK